MRLNVRPQVTFRPELLRFFVGDPARTHDSADRLMNGQSMPRAERELLIHKDLPRIGVAFLRGNGKSCNALVGRFVFGPLFARVLNRRGTVLKRKLTESPKSQSCL